jgi:ribosomal protein S10
MTISLFLTSPDYRLLDDAVAKTLRGIPSGEYQDLTVETIPVTKQDGITHMGRRINIIKPSEKIKAALSKIDVPHVVKITIR